jgi:PAS domain S-box-containing protein
MLERGGRMERVYVNEAHARMVDMTLEEVRALAPMEFVPPAERERLEALRAQFGTDRPGPPFVETVFRKKGGGDVPVELGLGYGMLQGARVTISFARDVSAKASIAEALRESEERFRQVAETSPDSVTIFSIPKWRYVYANPVALRLLGLHSQDQLEGLDPWRQVSAADRAKIEERVERVRAGEVIRPYQLRMAGPDGKEITLESSIAFIQVEGGPAVVSYTRDITERMLLQAELMKRDRLASVGLLAAGVAHELNNPLTSLGMQARMLRAYAESHGLPSEVREGLTHIDEAASRMATIISDLLFMARPSSSRRPMSTSRRLCDRQSGSCARASHRARVSRRPSAICRQCRATRRSSVRYSSTCFATPRRPSRLSMAGSSPSAHKHSPNRLRFR